MFKLSESGDDSIFAPRPTVDTAGVVDVFSAASESAKHVTQLIL